MSRQDRHKTPERPPLSFQLLSLTQSGPPSFPSPTQRTKGHTLPSTSGAGHSSLLLGGTHFLALYLPSLTELWPLWLKKASSSTNGGSGQVPRVEGARGRHDCGWERQAHSPR